jgi:hypothetical protein
LNDFGLTLNRSEKSLIVVKMRDINANMSGSITDRLNTPFAGRTLLHGMNEDQCIGNETESIGNRG